MSFQVGYPIAAEARDLELYQLLCEVAASRSIAKLGPDLAGLQRLRDTFEVSEVSRRLIAVAATVRSIMDSDRTRPAVARVAARPVGILTPDVDKKRAREPLAFREACNKVLHAEAIELSAGRGKSGAPIGRQIILLGIKGKLTWEARVDILPFVETAHRLP